MTLSLGRFVRPSGISCTKDCRLTLESTPKQCHWPKIMGDVGQHSQFFACLCCSPDTLWAINLNGIPKYRIYVKYQIIHLTHISRAAVYNWRAVFCIVIGSCLHCKIWQEIMQIQQTKHVLRTMWYIKVSCELVFLEQLRKYSKLLPICGIYTEKFWEILQTNIELYTCKQDCSLIGPVCPTDDTKY